MTFHQGTTWSIPFQIRLNGAVLSIAGSTIAAKLRKEIDDAAAVATFSCSIVDGANGRGQAVLSAATTSALTYDDSAAGEWNATYFFMDLTITLADATVLGPFRSKILARKLASR